MQFGAGLYVYSGGEANLNGCQVYENQNTVRACRPGPHLQRPAGTFRVLAFCMQYGAGLFVNYGGTANLEGCNVYSNEASVRRQMPLPGPFPPSPR